MGKTESHRFPVEVPPLGGEAVQRGILISMFLSFDRTEASFSSLALPMPGIEARVLLYVKGFNNE